MLRIDAIRGNEDSGWWLCSIIEKTLMREDFTPCPKLVVEAVNLMVEIGAYRRSTSQTKLLFVGAHHKNSKKQNEHFRVDLAINAFAKLVEVPLVESGELELQWWYAAHQFRRLFAILFVWRFEFAHLGALSYHLRHFNLNMTLGYVRDAELNRILGEEFHRLTVSKLQAFGRGDVKPVGILGRNLEKSIGRLRRQIELSGDGDLEQKIVRFVEERGLKLKPTVWGYCGASASPSNLRRAACQDARNMSRRIGVDGEPDASGSDEVTCARCLFHLTDAGRKSHWAETLATLTAALERPELSELMRRALSARMKVVKSFVENSQWT